MTALDRFMRKVEVKDGGCWAWCGAKKPSGYGNFYMNGKYLGAHVASVKLFRGETPPSGHYVCHSCDNPSCVNPDHLFVAEPKANTRDMMRKGRANGVAQGGDFHPGRKLTSGNVRTIREMRGDGLQLKEIAEKFGVHEATIHYVCSGKTWRGVA